MDPISTPASISALVAVTVTISKTLHDFKESFNAAPACVELLCSEYENISRLLYAYHARCLEIFNAAGDSSNASSRGVDKAYYMRTSNAVEASLRELSAKIDTVIVKGELLDNGPAGQTQTWHLTKRKKFRYYWEEKEINRVIQHLQSYKLTLNLTLAISTE
jgi:hypothetical protein